MSENKLPPDKQNSDSAHEQPAPVRKRRRWIWVVAGGVVLIVLLIALAPTLISTAPVRKIVLAQVNRSIDGALSVEDWSLGWTSGIRVHGVRLFHQDAQILELQRLETSLTLLDVLRGNLTFGQTDVLGLAFVAQIFSDGTTNFHRALKLQPSEGAVVVPDMSGRFKLDFRGTVTRQQPDGSWQTVQIDPSSVQANIVNINDPIGHTANVSLRVGDQPAGQIQADGSIKLFQKNELALDALLADETVQVRSLQLAALKPFVAGADISTLEGVASVQLAAKVAGIRQLDVQGYARIDDLAVGGAALSGDTYRTRSLLVQIPPTSVDQGTGRIVIGQSGSADQIVIQTDQGSVRLAVDATQHALVNLAEQRVPGSEGRIQATTELNLAQLAQQLPNTLRLPRGVKITSGMLHQVSTVAMLPNSADFNQDLKIENLAGVDAGGNRISAQPIEMSLAATSLGGGGKVPDLRDISLGFQSGFANVKGGGKSLAEMKIDGSADLAQFQQEAGQFVDFGEAALTGSAQFSFESRGNLAREGSSAIARGTLEVKNLAIRGATEKPITQKWLNASVRGRLQRGEEQLIKSIDDVVATLKTGDEANPAVDVKTLATVSLDDPAGAVMRFNVEKCRILLPAFQDEFGPLLAALSEKQLVFVAGAVDVSAEGSYGPDLAEVKSFTVGLDRVDLNRRLSQQPPVPVLANYSGTLKGAARFSHDPAGAQLTLSQAQYDDGGQLFSFAKSAGRDLVVRQGGGRLPAISGTVDFSGDVAALQRLVNLVTLPPGDTRTIAAGDLQSGAVSGTIDLKDAGDAQTRFDAGVTASNLSIATNARPIVEEQARIKLGGTVPANLTNLSLENLSVASSYGNINVTDALVRLPATTQPVAPMDMVQRATVSVDVPNLPMAVALAEAFVPGKLPIRSGATGRTNGAADEGDGLPPIAITSGALQINAKVQRGESGLQIDVPTLAAQKLAFQRGAGKFGPSELKLEMAAVAEPGDSGGAMVKSIQVNRLAGEAAVASITLEQPLSIDLSGPAISASGAIAVNGQLQLAMRLIEALGGSEAGRYDYSGDYRLTQRLGTQNDSVTAAGQVAITDFRAGLAERGAFREQVISLTNDVALDQAQKKILVNSLALDMQSSKALAFSLAGTIDDYERQRLLNLGMQLSYDADKLMKIVKPLLTPEQQAQLADITVAGVARDQQFTIGGKWPAVSEEAIEAGKRPPLFFVTASGVLPLQQVMYKGLTTEAFEIPVTLLRGRLATVYADRPEGQEYPAPIKIGNGWADLGGLQVDLLGDTPRATALRKNYKLLDSVPIPEEFAREMLKYATFLFADTQQAKGFVTVTVGEINQLPLGEALLNPPPKDKGRARLEVSTSELAVRSYGTQVLSRILDWEPNPEGSFPTNIRNAVFTIEDGVIRSKMGIEVGRQVLQVQDSAVRLSDLKIVNMDIAIPVQMLQRDTFGSIVAGAERLGIKTLQVPVSGSFTDLKIDVPKAFADTSLQAVPNVLPGLLGPKDDGKNGGGGGLLEKGGELLPGLIGPGAEPSKLEEETKPQPTTRKRRQQ